MLPAVSFVKMAAYQDGHPGNSDPLSEQNGIVTVINALMNSSDWDSTAVIISWDNFDGWYDHQFGPTVNPSDTQFDFLNGNSQCGTTPPTATAFQARCGFGPRLPYLVISPWAKTNFIDHTLTDQSSTMRFIEENWKLGFIDGSKAPPAGQASFDRTAGSIESMFDFTAEQSEADVDPRSGRWDRGEGEEVEEVRFVSYRSGWEPTSPHAKSRVRDFAHLSAQAHRHRRHTRA